MKNSAFLFIALFSFHVGTQAQQVEQQQRALVCKMTATWCQHCGLWGASHWEDLVTQNESKALMFQLHFSTSSDLYTPTTKAIYDQFTPSNSTPVYYVNGTNQMVYASQGINVTQSKTNITNMVNAEWQKAPVANVGFNFSLNGNSLTINSKTQFFTDTAGEYYVAAYLSLDNLFARQNVQGQGYVDRYHDKVIQYTLTPGSHFGTLAFSGAITSGSEASETFTYTLDADWTLSDVTAVCMIWKKEGTKYVYVNGTQKRLAEPTGVLQVAQTMDVSVYPTVSSGSLCVKANVNHVDGRLSVAVMDVSGKVITTTLSSSSGSLQTVVLDKSAHFGNIPGMYLLAITDGSAYRTEKVLIK